MGYEDDVVNEKPVEFNIDGRKFMYKPVTGGDENEWLKVIMEIDPELNTPKINWSQYNKMKLGNIVSVPYNREILKKVLGYDKEWCNLDIEEKYNFFGKLKPGIFDKIINAMKKIDETDEKTVKN